MPVVKGTRRRPKTTQISLDTKVAKLAIADFWHEDKDGTKYYVNVVPGKNGTWVRMRIDTEGEPITILMTPDTAMKLGMALQRAGFNARVLKREEVARFWNMLSERRDRRTVAQENESGQEGDVAEEEGKEAIEVPELEFA